MIHIDSLSNIKINDKEGNWHIAKPRPDNSIFSRLYDAWKVLKGEYIAVKFWEDDHTFGKD